MARTASRTTKTTRKKASSRKAKGPRKVTVRKLNRVLPENRHSRTMQRVGTLIAVFFVAYILFVFAGLGWSELVIHVDEKGYFALQDVAMEGLEKTSRQQVLSASGLVNFEEKQSNLLRLNLQRMTDEIVALPWVRNTYVERRLPHGLTITIEEQIPVAVAEFRDGSHWLCNDDALIFKKAENREGYGLPLFRNLKVSEVQEALLGESVAIAQMVDFLHMWKAATVQHSLKLLSMTNNRRGMRIQTMDASGAEFATIFGRTELEEKLQRFTRLWMHLKNRKDRRPEMVFLDNRSKPNWVTVRFRDEEQ